MNKIQKIIFVLSLLSMSVLVSCGAGVTETCNPTVTIMCPVGVADDGNEIADTTPSDDGQETDGVTTTDDQGNNDSTATSDDGTQPDSQPADDGTQADNQPTVGSQYCYTSTADTQAACTQAGGNWALFADGCRDSCYAEYYGEAVECTTANTYGCNCGADSCWDECGQTCY